MRILVLLLLVPIAAAGNLSQGIDSAAMVQDETGAYLVGGMRYTGSSEETYGGFPSDQFLRFTTGSAYETLPKMPVPLALVAAAKVDNTLYVFGGFDNGAHDTIYKFDFTTNTWSLLPTRLDLATYGMSAASDGERIYLAGGTNGVTVNQRLYVFDPTNQRMDTIANFDDLLRSPMPSTAWHGNFMYIFGGVLQGDTQGAQVFRFDPLYETIEPLDAKFQHLRLHRMGSAVAGNYIYLIGGTDRPLTAHQACQACAVNNNIYRYDPNRDALEIMNGFTPMLSGASAAQFGLDLLVIGGRGEPGDGASQNEFDLYSTATGYAQTMRVVPGRDPGHVRISWDATGDPWPTIRIEQWTGDAFQLVTTKSIQAEEFVHVAQDWDQQLRYRVSFIHRNGTIGSSMIADTTARDDSPPVRNWPAPDAEFAWDPTFPQACTPMTLTGDPLPIENVANETWIIEDALYFGNQVSHTFQVAGNYTVEYIVTDLQNRTDQVSYTLRVDRGPPRGEMCAPLPDEESPMGFLLLPLLMAFLLRRRFI